MQEIDGISENPKTQQAISSPPVNSEVPIIKFSLWYGFGAVDNASSDPFQIRVFIFDARIDSNGENYRNELYILKDSLYPKLLDAWQFPNGIIRFFAYESQLPSILAILNNSHQLWLKSKDGRVSITTNVKVIT